MAEIKLDKVKIANIIRNLQFLQSNPRLNYTLTSTPGVDSGNLAACGFVDRKADANDYDFDKDFTSGRLRICDITSNTWKHLLPAPVDASSLVAPSTPRLDMVIAKALSSKGAIPPATPPKPMLQHKLQLAQQHSDILQRAYSDLASQSTFFLIAEILKQFGYDAKLEFITRNLQHDRDHNLWELHSEGNIVLHDCSPIIEGETKLGTKIHFTSLATLSPYVKSYFSPQLKLLWNNDGPDTPPGEIMYTSASRHGFELQQMTVEDILPNPSGVGDQALPDNQFGVNTLIAAAGCIWDKSSHKTFQAHLIGEISAAKAFSPIKKLSSDLSKVLTNPVKTIVKAIVPWRPNLIDFSLTKLQKLICPESCELPQTQHLDSTTNPNTYFGFGELALLLQAETDLDTVTYLDSTNLFLPIKQIRAAKLTNPTRDRVLVCGKRYEPTELRRFISALATVSRRAELEFFGLTQSGHCGYSIPTDNDYDSITTDVDRNIRFVKQSGEQTSSTAAGTDTKLSQLISPLLEEASVSEPRVLLHLEIIKRIYNQSAVNFPNYLVEKFATILGLSWNITDLNKIKTSGDYGEHKSATNTNFGLGTQTSDIDTLTQNLGTTFSYDKNKGIWYCEGFQRKLAWIEYRANYIPIVIFAYKCKSSFKMPSLDAIDLHKVTNLTVQQDVNKLFPTGSNGFEIEEMQLEFRVPVNSRLSPQNYIQLVDVFLEWVINPDITNRDKLLSHTLTFIKLYS